MPKKGGKKKKGNEDGILSHPEFSDLTRAEYQVRISVLESKLRRAQEDAKASNINTAQLQKRLAEVEENEKVCQQIAERDIREKQNLLDNERSFVSKLNEDIAALKIQQAKDIEILQKQHQEDCNLLEEQIKKLVTDLEELVHFRDEKESLLTNLDDIKSQLTNEKETHERDVEEVKRQANIEKRKTRDAVIRKLRQTRDELFQLTDEHRSLKVQQTLRENERLQRDVAMYEKEMERVMTSSSKLQASVTQLSHFLGVEKDTNAELIKRTHAQEKMIHMLSEKLQTMEVESTERYKQLDQERQRKIAALSETVDKQYEIILELKNEMEELAKRSAEADAALHGMRKVKHAEREDVYQLQSFLVSCLNDVKKLTMAASSGGVGTGFARGGSFGASGPTVRLESLDTSDKMEILNYLLKRLNVLQSGLQPTPPSKGVMSSVRNGGGVGNGTVDHNTNNNNNNLPQLTPRPPPSQQQQQQQPSVAADTSAETMDP